MRKLYLAILFLFVSLSLLAQEISSQNDIAIFRLSSNVYGVPDFVYETSDERILQCFLYLERFNIIGLQTRFEAYNLHDFIEQLQIEREKTAEIPEAVNAGKMVFTRADWQRLINSYIVVVPVITEYKLELTESKWVDTDDDGKIDTLITTYSAKISLNFKIVNMRTGELIADFYINDAGTGNSQLKSINSALSFLPEKLEYKLRKINEFKIKSGIARVEGDNVEFELGKNMGISVGDEYAILGNDYTNNRLKEQESGLLLVTGVGDTYAQAKILYANEGIVFADQIIEVPRLPVEFKIYGNAFLGRSQVNSTETSGGFGCAIIHTRGFYRYRPFYGLEMTFSEKTIQKIETGMPLRLFVGGQLGNIFIRRFQFSPEVSAGAEMLIKSKEKKPELSALNLRAILSFNYLVSRDVKLVADIGGDMELDARVNSVGSPIGARLLLQFGIVIK